MDGDLVIAFLMASVASSLSPRSFPAFRLSSGGGGGGGFGAAPRRFFLGLSSSFLNQLRRMTSTGGFCTLTPLAWPKQGVSPVEQVLKDVEWPDKFPFKDEDFSRFDEYLNTPSGLDSA